MHLIAYVIPVGNRIRQQNRENSCSLDAYASPSACHYIFGLFYNCGNLPVPAKQVVRKIVISH